LLSRLWSRWLTLRAAGHRHFGNLYGDRESYENAIADLTYAIRHDPANAEAYAMRGTLYWREFNQLERAIRDLSEALELSPRRWDALLSRGLAHQAAGEIEPALADLRRYAAGAPAGVSRDAAERLCLELEGLRAEQGAPSPAAGEEG